MCRQRSLQLPVKNCIEVIRQVRLQHFRASAPQRSNKECRGLDGIAFGPETETVRMSACSARRLNRCAPFQSSANKPLAVRMSGTAVTSFFSAGTCAAGGEIMTSRRQWASAVAVLESHSPGWRRCHNTAPGPRGTCGGFPPACSALRTSTAGAAPVSR